MPEGPSNVEIAHRIHEQAVREGEREEQAPRAHGRRNERTLEIAEAVLLAMVAIATAWSGYQAARWDGRSALLYGESSRLRTTAAQLENSAGQLKLYDTSTFNFWLDAKLRGDERLAGLFQARFRPEYQVAFAAWLGTDPFNNPGALPGPSAMPQYHVATSDQGASLELQSSARFDAATEARDRGDDYVRLTVFLAAVLFLIAMSQRFQILRVRIGVLATAVVFLSFSLYSLATYQHL